MLTPPESIPPASPEQPAVLHEHDVENVRTAARWTMATSGAIATVLLAGFQFGNLAATAQGSLLFAAISAILCLAATAIVLLVFRSAARVLVPDRLTLDALVKEEATRLARSQGVNVGRAPKGTRKEAADLIPMLVDEVHAARSWLLPQGCSTVTDLEQRLRTADAGDRDLLNRAAAQVVSYARMEIARARYRKMVDRLTGRYGAALALCLVGLAVMAGVENKSPARVSDPYPVTVTFNETQQAERLIGGCAGQTIDGVAVAGTFREPEVAFSQSRCGGKVVVSDAIGVAVPTMKN